MNTQEGAGQPLVLPADGEPAGRSAAQRAVAWVRSHWVIVAIVATTVLVGVALSAAADAAGQSFATVLIGLTLVASLAILASAITAAIYAKPAYDAAVAHLPSC